MVVAATGSRPGKLNREYDMIGPMSDWIVTKMDEVLDEYKPSQCISGMALGIDMLFAVCAISKGIPVLAAIPFKGQESMWPQKSQDTYNAILKHKLVEKVYVCDPGYSAQKMQIRNEFMVDRCDILLAFWDGTPGGTANCRKYARKVGAEIIRINPEDFKK